MINEQNLQRIRNAQAILDELFPLVDEAERQFKSARNRGFIDQITVCRRQRLRLLPI